MPWAYACEQLVTNQIIPKRQDYLAQTRRKGRQKNINPQIVFGFIQKNILIQGSLCGFA
jgi:hypothetical protein